MTLSLVASLLLAAPAAASAREYVIVALGDSYASGEGNPDTPRTASWPAVWSDPSCHRSRYAPAAQAAEILRAREPQATVRLLSRACSGAVTGDVISSQIPQIRRDLAAAPAHVDMVVVGIGGNDMGFGDVIQKCVLQQICRHSDAISDLMGGSVSDQIQDTQRELPAKLDAVIAAVRGLAPYVNYRTRIVLTEYPDPTRYATNGYCSMLSIAEAPDPNCRVARETCKLPTCNWLGLPLGCLDKLSKETACTVANSMYCWRLSISSDESQFTSSAFLPTLNMRLSEAAKRNRVQYAGGIAAASVSHGYCASDTWIRTYDSAVATQGCELSVGGWLAGIDLASLDVLLPGFSETHLCYTKGVLHPNIQGARNIADAIVRAWDADVPAALPWWPAVESLLLE